MIKKEIIASGPVIIKEGRLLVTKEDKDDFYKIPGGKVHEGETLEETCLREFTEETGFKCRIIKKLPTMKLNKDPQTGKSMKVKLHHYLCELIAPISNYNSFEYNEHKVRWIKIDELLNRRYPVAPNIKFLVEKGYIK